MQTIVQKKENEEAAITSSIEPENRQACVGLNVVKNVTQTLLVAAPPFPASRPTGAQHARPLARIAM